jgi:hypothetical protein
MALANVNDVCLVDGHFSAELQPYSGVSVVRRLKVPAMRHPLEFACEHIANVSLHRRHPVHQSLSSFLRVTKPRGGPPEGPASGTASFFTEEADLQGLLPGTVHAGICEMIETLDRLLSRRLLRCNGVRVYAPVVDKFWGRPDLTDCLMTSVPHLYIAGDGTGLARGIVQSIFGGIVVADAIIRGHHRPPHTAMERLAPREELTCQ